jgi:hypothetical protein
MGSAVFTEYAPNDGACAGKAGQRNELQGCVGLGGPCATLKLPESFSGNMEVIPRLIRYPHRWLVGSQPPHELLVGLAGLGLLAAYLEQGRSI